MSICYSEFEAALDAILKGKVEAALTDCSPSIPHADVFAGLLARHEKRTGR